MATPSLNAFPPPGRLLESAGLPRRVHEALEMTLELVVERIAQPLVAALPALANQSVAVNEFGAHHRVNIDVVDAPRRLANDGTAMTRLFLGFLERDLAALRDPAPAAPPSRTPLPGSQIPSFGELRLVDEDEDDIATILGALTLRHEARAALPLQLLCQRFGVLAASPAFEPGTVPVGPRRLAELLVEACTVAGFGLQLTGTVLREFDRQVLPAYEGFAESLNGLLSRLGVMPGLSYVPLRLRARAQEAEAEPEVGPRAHAPGPPAATEASYEGADTEVFELLQELLAKRRGMAGRFQRHDPHAPPRPALDTRAALDLLAQADPGQPPGDFEAIRQWLLLQARRRHGEAIGLSAQDADTFELLGLLYGHLAEDVRANTPAARMMDRLRLPLARIALRDHDFFVRPAHPARRLLNAVAETGAAWSVPDDADPQLVQQVEQVVEAIARTPDDVERAFADAARTLEVQQQATARRTEIAERRSVESARGKERLAVARRRAADVIENAIGGERLPVFHRNMLRQAWADVLTLAHLRHGEDAEDWVALVGDTRDLVLAGARGEPAPEGLGAQVEQWLVTVGHHADDAARIARILTAAPEGEVDDAASRTELAMRLKSRARLGEDATAAVTLPPPRTPTEETAYQRLRTLSFGTWLGVAGEDGAMLRRRLAWWSPATDAVLLVNARGQRAAETTLDALARDIAAGRAQLVPADEGGLVDRAWRKAVTSLRALVGSPPGDAGGGA